MGLLLVPPPAEDPAVSYLPVTGGTMVGPVLFQSTFAGGENTFDSTRRITIESYQRAQQRNTAGDYAHYGEGIRLRLMRPNAKNMIAWEDGFTDPANPRSVAWVGAHYLPNDVTDPLHKHWSIEVSDSQGDLRTRLAVNYGVDWANVRVANADFTVGSAGIARLAGSASHEKVLEFSNDSEGTVAARRWRLVQVAIPEGGGNSGSDLRLQSYADNGSRIADVIGIRRSTGTVVIGGPVPSELGRMHVKEPGGRHSVFAEQTAGLPSTWALYGGSTSIPANRALDFRSAGDSTGRFVVTGAGELQWGSGTAGRDTNLYRKNPRRLATDSDLEVAAPDRGVILTSPNGSKFRLKVSNTGELATTTA